MAQEKALIDTGGDKLSFAIIGGYHLKKVFRPASLTGRLLASNSEMILGITNPENISTLYTMHTRVSIVFNLKAQSVLPRKRSGSTIDFILHHLHESGTADSTN